MHVSVPPHISDLYCDEATGLWHVSRYAQAVAILKSDAVVSDDLHANRIKDLSKRTGRDLSGLIQVLSWFVFQNEGDAHKQIRQGISTAAADLLTPDKKELRALSEALCTSLQPGPRMDAVTDIAEPFFDAQLTRFLGIPADDVRQARILFRDLIAIPFSIHRLAWLEERNKSAHEICARLNAIADPQLMLDLPDGVTLAHVVASLTFAQDAVIALTARILIELGKNSKAQSDLRSEPDKIGDYIHESLRVQTPFRYIWRVVQGTDLEILDRRFAPGTRFKIDLLAMNIDLSADGHADHFDPDPPRCPHVSFALGHHKCMGLRNTYASVETLISSVLHHFEIEPATQPVTYGEVAAIERPVAAPLVLRALHPEPDRPMSECLQ